MNEFKFTPEKGFLDSAKFPDPGGEQDARTQLMALHNQTRDYINNTILPEIQTIEGATGNQEAINALTQQIKDATEASKPDKVQSAEITLLASNWKDGIYTIEDSRITSDVSVQGVSTSKSDTEAQLLMLQKANIHDAGQEAGKLYLKAWGEVPTSDIPVVIVFWGG